MKNSREIEVKYLLKDWKLETLGRRIQSLPFLNIARVVVKCETTDFYFPPHNTVSNIRLRDSWGQDMNGFSTQLKEITFKSKDQESNFNRLEENIKIDDCLPAYRSLCLLFGQPILKVHKEEQIFWTVDGMVISTAQVNNTQDIYLEIEGPTEEKVLNYCTSFEEIFEMKKEGRSLLEIFGTVVK